MTIFREDRFVNHVEVEAMLTQICGDKPNSGCSIPQYWEREETRLEDLEKSVQH